MTFFYHDKQDFIAMFLLCKIEVFTVEPLNNTFFILLQYLFHTFSILYHFVILLRCPFPSKMLLFFFRYMGSSTLIHVIFVSGKAFIVFFFFFFPHINYCIRRNALLLTGNSLNRKH